MTNQHPNLLTVTEALTVLGISRATFDRWKKEKQLPYIKIGKEVFVNKDKLEQWMAKFDFSENRKTLKDMEKTTIHIGYQTGSAQLWSSIIIKKLQLFEKQLSELLPNQSIHVEWHHAHNGIDLVQQFLSNQLHFIAVGDFPIHISFNLARIFPHFDPLLIAFDGKTVGSDGIALVLHQEETTITKTLDIATVTSTSSEYHLQQLMKKKQLPFNTMAKLSMEACMTSFLQHEVDAAMMWEPYLTVVEQLSAGKRLEIQEEDADAVYLTGILANQNLITEPKQKHVTIAYLKSLLLAHQLLHEKDRVALKAIEEETGFSQATISSVLSRIRYDAIVYHDDIKRINKIYNESTVAPISRPDSDFQTMSHITHPKINFDASYLNEAIKQLNLPEMPKHSLAGHWIKRCY